MGNFYKYVEDYLDTTECLSNNKYCRVGHTFCVCNEEIEGLYWFYESDNFIIDIHDFLIKKEVVQTSFLDIRNFISLSTSYIITANGESFNPYQTIVPHSLYVLDFDHLKTNYRVLFHANFPYLSVGINFKKQMVDDYLSTIKNKDSLSYSDMVLNTMSTTIKALVPLSKDILECKMTSPAAELFFEAKAKEWLSIIIDSLINKKEINIAVEDDKALENVANYLNDHYAITVSQETLEKISMMSGTKLKRLFKQKYQSSITEYTQRRRMNIAETLLLNSSLKIQDIAEAVGYSSHSKFSICFKKYKGVHPRDMRKIASQTANSYPRK